MAAKAEFHAVCLCGRTVRTAEWLYECVCGRLLDFTGWGKPEYHPEEEEPEPLAV